MNLDSYRHALVDPDPERRRQAVIALGEGWPDGALEPLLEALGDSDWRVRKEAVRVVAERPLGRDVVRGLLAGVVQGENVGKRNSALEALAKLGSAVAPSLLEELPSIPPQAKKFVLGVLGEIPDDRVLPVLVRACEDDDPNLVAAAIDALARHGGPLAESALRKRLQSSDPYQRMAALDGLARLGAFVAWEELEPLLADRLVRRVALSTLGGTGRAEAIPPLVEALTDRSSHVVGAAAVALAQLLAHSESLRQLVAEHATALSGQARESLRSMLHQGDAQARVASAHLLLLAQDEPSLHGVVSLAVNDVLSPGALDALRGWGAGAAEPLLSLFRTIEGHERAMALELAADLLADARAHGSGCSESLEATLRRALREGLCDLETSVALAAARSMIHWVEVEDAPLLVRAARRGHEALGRACAEALIALCATAPEVVRTAIENVAFEDEGGAALASVAARLGGPRVSERLHAAMSADDPGMRRAALEALSELREHGSAELIGYALADEHIDVQAAAARALGTFSDSDERELATNALRLVLDSGTSAVQAAAVRALGEAGDEVSIPSMRRLVASDSPEVVVAAIEALGRLHDPDLPDLLVRALDHPDEEVVKQALLALVATSGEQPSPHVLTALTHPAWDVRALAARLLGPNLGPKARAVLVDRLAVERNDLVRTVIEDVLGETEST